MADKNTLRAGEPHLEQLPMQVPTPVQNPMWAFLKGIEDFDNTRATDCLVRLLDAHYDTVSVLKLATKQDLIEDVGLKPGDALRIVSAAKGPVARCNVCCPESHQPACESPEPRKRKRKKTAAQETQKSNGQDVMNQAAPKEANKPPQTIPVPKEHACGICNVMYNSQTELHSHFYSTIHAHFMGLATKSDDKSLPTYLHCSTCKVRCHNKKQLVEHLNGKGHKRR